jgi:P pilus assembly chaperone PapD
METIMKQNLKKIGFICLGIILFLAFTTVTINWWIDAKLPQIISNKNETPYHIQYRELEISLLSKTIVAKGISIIPKEREKEALYRWSQAIMEDL